ncbi:MAG: hypothetical protein U5R30_01420 [Deltaproteobacteria bacterium]|nr:hypothetical protein [Deltaproteobacteria bacterium]
MTPDLMIARRLFAIFLLGCLLFNYPILSLFNLELFLGGIPLLYVYLFAAWTVMIVMIVFIMRAQNKSRAATDRRHKRPEY